MNKLSHISAQGQVQMVDITDKKITVRTACATSTIHMQKTTLDLILSVAHKKGDVLATARIAGIQAGKKCADLIPLCHPLMLSKISIEFIPEAETSCIKIISKVKLSGKTGAEMEALTAASIASLAIYDMCKAVDRGMIISDICVLEKKGGKSGHWQKTTDAK